MKHRIVSTARLVMLGLPAVLCCASQASAGPPTTTQFSFSGYNGLPIWFSGDGRPDAAYDGGNIVPNSFGGVQLPFLYCVQYTTDIVEGTKYYTTVSRDGSVNGDTSTINNAGEVAWLMANIAPGATSADAQAGLQAAIWKEVSTSFTLDTDTTKNSQDVQNFYNADLTALGSNTASPSVVMWLSSNTNSDLSGGYAQDLVAYVPEPSSLFGAVVAGVSVTGVVVRRRQRKTNA